MLPPQQCPRSGSCLLLDRSKRFLKLTQKGRVLNLGQQKILTAGVRRPSRKRLTFNAMNSPELPCCYHIIIILLSYYYHIFLVSQHKKLSFSLFWGYLETICLLMTSFYQGKWVKTYKIWTKRQKSEWVNENPYAKWNPFFHHYTSWKSEQ